MALSDPERARESRRAEGESKGQTAAPVAHTLLRVLVVCSDGTFYVGCTSDLRERERTHNEGHGAEYTAVRLPVRMIYSEEYESWPAARKREAQLKRWSHAKKKALVEGNAQLLQNLAKRRR